MCARFRNSSALIRALKKSKEMIGPQKVKGAVDPGSRRRDLRSGRSMWGL